jgi:1-deoxy-D-xylulose 5-phosphate reductoisomerase
LEGRIRFGDIARINEAVLERLGGERAAQDVEAVIDLDGRARRAARQVMERHAS